MAQELEGVRTLWKQNLVPISRVTTLERDSARMEGERSALVASLAQSRGRIAELELKIHQIDQDLSTEVGKELAEIRAKRSEMTERRVAADDQLKRIDLVCAAGRQGVPAQRPYGRRRGPGRRAADADRAGFGDADRRRQGRAAGYRPDSCRTARRPALRRLQPAARRPRSTARSSISAPTSRRTTRRPSPITPCAIRVSEGELARLKGLQLLAGMPVEAFIQTTPRTVASFLVKPFTDQLNRAFRGR